MQDKVVINHKCIVVEKVKTQLFKLTNKIQPVAVAYDWKVKNGEENFRCINV